MRAKLKWLVVALYLLLMLTLVAWPDPGNATLASILQIMAVVSLLLAPALVIVQRDFFAQRPGLLLVAALTVVLWAYFQQGSNWLAARLEPMISMRVDLLCALLGLHLLLATPVVFIVWMLRRDASLWLLGISWFLNPLLIFLFASRFGSIEQMLTMQTLGSFQADMAWMLPNCLTGAACVVGSLGFVAYFVRLLVLEAEGRPIKTA
ncbi:hypothetical protein [Candidatus Amarolinea dominans]|uniref:hypothetical protein n=1 Tax=Candidatus Amarolinea dominans TaxID=3140696 RepID=UPI001D2E0793|nr:hypothetical protein [Anaerolineae bacterium]